MNGLNTQREGEGSPLNSQRPLTTEMKTTGPWATLEDRKFLRPRLSPSESVIDHNSNVDEFNAKYDYGLKTPEIKISRSSLPSSQKISSSKRRASEFFMKKDRKDISIGSMKLSSFAEDMLSVKSLFTTKPARSTKQKTSKLLGVIAGQAVNGKNPEISKILAAALV